MNELIGLEEAMQNHTLASWLIGYLWILIDVLGRDLAHQIAPQVLSILPTIMMLLLTWYSLKLVMLWGGIGENLREILKVVIAGAIASALLAMPDQFFYFLITPIINAGAELGHLVLWTTLDPEIKSSIESGRLTPGPGISGNPVAEMVWLVDLQIDWVIWLGFRILQASDGFSYVLNYIPRTIAAAPLVILGISLLGLFTAYTVEALFNFLVGAIALPISVATYVVPAGRAYLGAIVRLLLAGAFTLVFLSLAMGFTGRMVSVLSPNILAEVSGNLPVQEIKKRQQKIVISCRIPASKECENAKAAMNDMDKIVVFGPAYVLLLILLISSIIVHMKAKTLASNLAGVNDGPGPAAAVVGLATTGAGAIWGATKWAAAKGTAPISKGISNKFSGSSPSGSGGSNNNETGGATSRRVSTNNENTQSSSSPSSPPSSGSSSGPDLAELNKNLSDLVKKLGRDK